MARDRPGALGGRGDVAITGVGQCHQPVHLSWSAIRSHGRRVRIVASTDLVVDGITFPSTVTSRASAKVLQLLGHGVTDMTIETILVKFTTIGVYAEEGIKQHLKSWKGKPVSELTAEESGYFKDFTDAPVEKFIKVGVIKGIKGSQYGGSLESSLRDRLAYDDKYEEEEESALEGLVQYFNTKHLPPGSSIFFLWPSPSVLQVSISDDQSIAAEPEHVVENENVAKYLLHWIVGENGLSPTTSSAVAEGVAALL